MFPAPTCEKILRIVSIYTSRQAKGGREKLNSRGKTRVLMRYKFSTVYLTNKKWNGKAKKGKWKNKRKKIKYARYSPPFSDYFLEGIKGNNPVKFLIKAMESKNFRVRENAAWALGNIGDDRAVKPLTLMMTNVRRLLKRLNWRLRRCSTTEAILHKLNTPRQRIYPL